MKTWTYIIAATVCVALSATFLTSPAPSTAQDGGQTLTRARVEAVEPSVAPAPGPSAKLLYFAPAENRNIALDEGMIELRRNGIQVAYVTDAEQFADFLFTST